MEKFFSVFFHFQNEILFPNRFNAFKQQPYKMFAAAK